MQQKERLLTALLLEEPDVVPVSIRLNPGILSTFGRRFFEWALENTSSLFRISLSPNIFYAPSYVRYRSYIIASRESYILLKLTLETPKGCLSSIVRETSSEGSWVVKPFISNEEDIDRFLSIPEDVPMPRFEEYDRWVRILGDRALICITFLDAIGVVASLFRLNDFLKVCIEKLHLIKEMVRSVSRRIELFIEKLLEKGLGPLYEIVGPEYVCQTFFKPSYFMELALSVDHALVKLVHEYGYLIGMHCHGKIRAVLEEIARAGFDALHPVEEPPGGDVTLAEAKKLIGHKLCLIGNIPHGLLDSSTPKEVVNACHKAIKVAAPGGGYILEPTATPLASSKVENLVAMARAGRLYGKYPVSRC